MDTKKIKKYWPLLAGIALGAAGGYLYYIKVGCSSGTCPITSNPLLTMLWGGVMGYLVGDMFVKKNTGEGKSE